MGSLAKLARDIGFKVTGCDTNVYPPMSSQLIDYGIELTEGFDNDQLKLKPDLWVIGNIATRKQPIIETILNQKLDFISGPSFLKKYILPNRQVVAVAGTHGKTTTSSILAWIFEYAGKKPGFLIGGIPKNFNYSAKIGDNSGIFVLEADEYDTAFFDKRSKFLHYTPKISILNNLEFDHADIFDDVKDIEKQFFHWLKIIPSESKILVNKYDENLVKLIRKGLWSKHDFFNDEEGWHFESLSLENKNYENIETPLHTEFEKFLITDNKRKIVEFKSSLTGDHNKSNILAAVVAANEMGVSLEESAEAVESFKGIKRRLELRGEVLGVKIYDDFAHHPTAIEKTIKGIKNRNSNQAKILKTQKEPRIIAIVELRSNSMRMGAMKEKLAHSLKEADFAFVSGTNFDLKIEDVLIKSDSKITVTNNEDYILQKVREISKSGDIVLIMSNGSFGGLHEKILNKLMEK